MVLRRGFKAEANRLADQIREELGLKQYAPLAPSVLAEYLEIPIKPLSELAGESVGAIHLLKKDPKAFSAATIFHGSMRMILHNDSHTPGRQNSNIAHELSHALLFHEPHLALSGFGCRNWNEAIEQEAEWLAGVLLIPDRIAVSIARGYQGTLSEAANYFGVSASMLQYRMNMSAAYQRASVRFSS